MGKEEKVEATLESNDSSVRAATKPFHSHKSLVELVLLLPHDMEAGGTVHREVE